MRGDQLARQWRIIRAIEASPGGLTVTEIAEREETGIRTIFDFGLVTQDTGQFLAQDTGVSWDVGLKTRDSGLLFMAAGFPLYTEKIERSNRCAFIDTFKFKIPPFLSRRAAKFAKQKILNFLPFKYIDFKSRAVFQRRIKILAVLAPWRERVGRFHAPQLQGDAR